MEIKQLICRHKYADRNLMCEHDKARGVFVFRNFCVKCGYESLHEIDEYALYIAAKADSKLSAADVRPVKRGVWRKLLQNDDGTSDYECSACAGFIVDVPDDDLHPLCSYCPNCGADMRNDLVGAQDVCDGDSCQIKYDPDEFFSAERSDGR